MTALDIASAAAKDNANCAIIQQKLEDAGGIRFHVKPRFNSKQGGDRDIVNTQIVVASLIATVTFAAIFQIPGGIEDDKNSIHYGAAKMAFHELFQFFIYSDIVAFITSFTVVVAWLLRQLFGDAYFGTTFPLSHKSVVTLLFSIFCTTAAFMSATIVITVPSNFMKSKSMDNNAFFNGYQGLLVGEISISLLSALYVGVPLLLLVSQILTRTRKIEDPKILIMRIAIHVVAFLTLFYVFAY
ncbi:hypothetical protein SUGI_0550700 [Cryptomeria japonica]|nr:hypothetical protein SUGI_0550700 [Cryptomeria japonica]